MAASFQPDFLPASISAYLTPHALEHDGQTPDAGHRLTYGRRVVEATAGGADGLIRGGA